jgi:hypothetical protein
MTLTGRFDNGVHIDPVFSALYESATEEERARFGDWRRVSGPESFWEWATAPRAHEGRPSRLHEALASTEQSAPLAPEQPKGLIVVGATCAPYKLSSEYEFMSWIENQDEMAVDAASMGFSLAWFLALEDDGAKPRWTQLMNHVDDSWSFSLRNEATKIDGIERLIRICTGRNLIVEYAMRRNADWILYLDTDLKPAPDTISKLIALKWPIVGGNVPAYCLSGPTVHGIEWTRGWGGIKYDFPVEDHWNTAGYLLVHRDVYRKLCWRTDLPMTDDPCYAHDARQLGWPTLVRKDLIGHHTPLGPVEERGHDLRL